MRGEDTQNQTLFSYVRTDYRIPSNHPLRLIRQIADAALTSLSDQFDAVYSRRRPSHDPAGASASGLPGPGLLLGPVRAPADGATQLQPAVQLVRGSFGRRSGLGPSTFSKNRERVLNEEFAASFLDAV